MQIRGNSLTRLIVVAFILAMTSAGNAFAKELTTTPQDQQTRTVPDGETVKKFKGIVVKRDPDSFTMSDTMGGTLTSVLLTADTEVKSHKKGAFRGSKEYGASYILRGLRLEVDGVGNSAGQLVADKIRFDEQDLRSAQALKATVDPIEAEMRKIPAAAGGIGTTRRPDRGEPSLNLASTSISGCRRGGSQKSPADGRLRKQSHQRAGRFRFHKDSHCSFQHRQCLPGTESQSND
jgi:hypothetical protein